ncbi:MAG TPA: JAB domain-containing protein [Candidatus Nitrosotalea sp.]|nr:JAB domain-containing protein [Candidatus Nitrosotalea sp.]
MSRRDASHAGRQEPEVISDDTAPHTWAGALAAPSQSESLAAEAEEVREPAKRVGFDERDSQERPPYRVAESARAPSTLRAIRGPEDVYDVCPALRTRRVEEFCVLLLNARHEVQRRVMISRGSLNASIVHPREVFRPAILGSAASVVLVHNHPSGDPEPSDEDLAITKRLAQVGELLGIAVLDHVVIAKRGFVSLRARGQL